MVIKRDKSVQEFNCTDLVKYFARQFESTNKRKYDLVYARDCSIMLRIIAEFHKLEKKPKDLIKFINDMFEEYPKRRRILPIDISWLYTMTSRYLYKKEVKKGNKMKAPDIELTDELKEWLKEEKRKLLDDVE